MSKTEKILEILVVAVVAVVVKGFSMSSRLFEVLIKKFNLFCFIFCQTKSVKPEKIGNDKFGY